MGRLTVAIASLRGPWILLAAVALAYSSASLGVFQFDDYNVIVDNPAVTNWPPDLSGLRPLLKLSYALNWSVGSAPIGFHLFNVLVHWLNAVLVLMLCHRLSSHYLPENAARHAALAGALLFALHPVHTEAVTYISGRSSSLMTCLYLASLLAYDRGRVLDHRGWLWVASPLLFAAALLTKETALTLPLALLLWELFCPAGSAARHSWWRAQWVHWSLLLVAAIIALVHSTYSEMLVFEPTLTTLRTQVHGVAYLMTRWIRLDDLNIDPDLPLQEDWNPLIVGQALGLAALLAVGAWAAVRRPWLGFGVLWFFVHLLPGNTLILRWDVASERQLYLAGIGLFAAAGIEWTRFTSDLPRPASRIAASALLAVLAAFTWNRNLDYRSEVALWEDTARKSPAKARAHNNLGEAYRLAGSLDLARASFRRALELDPGYLLARNNLRGLEMRTQRSGRVPASGSPSPAPLGLDAPTSR